MSINSRNTENIKNLRLIIYASLNNILIKKGYTDLVIRHCINKYNVTEMKEISFINEAVYGIVRNKNKIDFAW